MKKLLNLTLKVLFFQPIGEVDRIATTTAGVVVWLQIIAITLSIAKCLTTN